MFKRTPLIFFSTIAFLILLDLTTKWYFEGKRLFLDNFIFIYSTQNTGSAFGIFSSLPYYNLIIILLSLTLLLGAIHYRKKIFDSSSIFIIVIFFTSGLIGNLFDRLFFGYVRDFLGFQGLFIINIADLYLTICAILLILHEFSENKHLKTKKQATK